MAVLTANIIFGLNIPATRAIMEQWMTPLGFTTTRMVFGAMVFWLIGMFTKREKVERKDLIVILFGGLLGYLGTQFLFSQSLKHTTPVIFSLLSALAPVVVLVLSAIFLKERPTRRKLFGILLSMSGAALIIVLNGSGGQQNGTGSLGIVFSLLTVLCFASFLVITRKVSMKYHPVTIAKWMFLISALVVLPFGFSEIPQQKVYTEQTTFFALGLVAFALIFATSISYFLMPLALKRLEASTVSIFMNLQPIVASMVAITAGQDVFTWDKPLAAVLVIGGVYLVTMQKRIQLRSPWKFSTGG